MKPYLSEAEDLTRGGLKLSVVPKIGKCEPEVFESSAQGAFRLKTAGGAEDAGFEQAEGAEPFEASGKAEVFKRIHVWKPAHFLKGVPGAENGLVSEIPAEIFAAQIG